MAPRGRDSLRWNGTVWVAQIDLGRRPDGRQIKRKKHLPHPDTAAGERAARADMGVWIDALMADQVDPERRTVADMVDEWRRLKSGSWSDAHRDNTARIAETKIKPRIGTVPLAEVNRHTIERLYAELGATGAEDGGPLGARSIKHVHALLSASFTAALGWGWVDRSPMVGVSSPRTVDSEINPPSLEQIQAAEARIREPFWRALYRLAYATGARRGELVALRWSDFRDDQLLIERSMTTSGRLKAPKSGRSRLITIDEVTVAAVLGDWRREADQIAEAIGVRIAPDGFVFPARPDRRGPMRADRVTAWWCAHRRRVPALQPADGEPRVRFHDHRHFHATYLLMNGEELWKVSGRLGHSDVAVTARVYAHYIPGKDRSSAALMAGL